MGLLLTLGKPVEGLSIFLASDAGGLEILTSEGLETADAGLVTRFVNEFDDFVVGTRAEAALTRAEAATMGGFCLVLAASA